MRSTPPWILLTFERQPMTRTGQVATRRQGRNGARGAGAEGHAASRQDGQIYGPRGRETWSKDMPSMRSPHTCVQLRNLLCQQSQQQQPAPHIGIYFLILIPMIPGGSVYVPLPRPKTPSPETSKVGASNTASPSSSHNSFQKLRSLLAAPDGRSSLDLLRRDDEESSTLVRVCWSKLWWRHGKRERH